MFNDVITSIPVHVCIRTTIGSTSSKVLAVVAGLDYNIQIMDVRTVFLATNLEEKKGAITIHRKGLYGGSDQAL